MIHSIPVDILPVTVVFQQACFIHGLLSSTQVLVYRRDKEINTLVIDLIDVLNNAEKELYNNTIGTDARCEVYSYMQKISEQWHNLNDSGKVDEIKDFQILLKRTITAFQNIKVLPREGGGRSSSAKIEKNKLKDINEKRNRLQEELEKAKHDNSENLELISSLQKQLQEANKQYLQVSQELGDVIEENEKENNIRNRIESAFSDLRTYTEDINHEKIWARIEMYIFFLLTLIIILFLIHRYIIFVELVANGAIIIESWFDYLPYAGGFTICFLLIWLSVYLKNRANKIAVELSSQLFYIHYLEGLLKMVNALSKNSVTAMDKINKAVDDMLQGYLKQIERINVSSKEINLIEEKEMNGNPYWKIMNELKNMINKN